RSASTHASTYRNNQVGSLCPALAVTQDLCGFARASQIAQIRARYYRRVYPRPWASYETDLLFDCLMSQPFVICPLLERHVKGRSAARHAGDQRTRSLHEERQVLRRRGPKTLRKRKQRR